MLADHPRLGHRLTPVQLRAGQADLVDDLDEPLGPLVAEYGLFQVNSRAATRAEYLTRPDLGRALGGEGPGPYTWWSWRGRGFDTDGGWRIDYALASRKLGERATGAVVHKAPSYAERWSDHAPLTVDLT